mmetsp:Transcript_10556/g.25795  ORF Transcript_10556/g.25795 Transcript_10556/m.25795 type:complete len:516 (-) Transcript_10556:236-1783(-)|eukprot:CAMPEP_0114526260 /NCGR_PEP_ID=MMETSP0109-20121206/22917_1 /TAXON_ID=29199 /ORGANISM="Chlorarachnion reptans, Strain CCCM449" /LENGTH=515 /DNA_ID=CAMNT_0001708005 /DNA_START=171 /DNA_END=1718 /DNA_ORIENTATION=+
MTDTQTQNGVVPARSEGADSPSEQKAFAVQKEQTEPVQKTSPKGSSEAEGTENTSNSLENVPETKEAEKSGTGKRRRRRNKKKNKSTDHKDQKDQKLEVEPKAVEVTLDEEEQLAIQKENPYLVISHKRLRAIRKRMDRIERVEKAVAEGQKINQDQQAALNSKSTVQAMLTELEKLHGMMTSYAKAEKLEEKKQLSQKQAAEIASKAEHADEQEDKKSENKEIQTEADDEAPLKQHFSVLLATLSAAKSLSSESVPKHLSGKITESEIRELLDLNALFVEHKEGNSSEAASKLILLGGKSTEKVGETTSYARLRQVVEIILENPAPVSAKITAAPPAPAQVPVAREAPKQEITYEFMVPSKIQKEESREECKIEPSPVQGVATSPVKQEIENKKILANAHANPSTLNGQGHTKNENLKTYGKKNSGRGYANGRGRRGRGRGRGRRNGYQNGVQGRRNQYKNMPPMQTYPPHHFPMHPAHHQLPHVSHVGQYPSHMHHQMPPYVNQIPYDQRETA